MANLSEAMAEGARAGLPVLVFNPSGDIDELEQALGQLAPGRRVISHDWSDGAPERIEIARVVDRDVGDEQLLHLVVAAQLEPQLEHALLEIAASGHYPGQPGKTIPRSAMIVVSTKARYLTEMSTRVAEHFPLKVGAAQWQK